MLAGWNNFLDEFESTVPRILQRLAPNGFATHSFVESSPPHSSRSVWIVGSSRVVIHAVVSPSKSTPWGKPPIPASHQHVEQEPKLIGSNPKESLGTKRQDQDQQHVRTVAQAPIATIGGCRVAPIGIVAAVATLSSTVATTCSPPVVGIVCLAVVSTSALIKVVIDSIASSSCGSVALAKVFQSKPATKGDIQNLCKSEKHGGSKSVVRWCGFAHGHNSTI